MSKELIEQLAKEKAQEFKFSELGCELHEKINCGDISANAFMEAYQAQTQGQSLPTEPTDEMIRAAIKADYKGKVNIGRETLIIAYRAMLNAAPQPESDGK
jgi:hypothetical protein